MTMPLEISSNQDSRDWTLDSAPQEIGCDEKGRCEDPDNFQQAMDQLAYVISSKHPFRVASRFWKAKRLIQTSNDLQQWQLAKQAWRYYVADSSKLADLSVVSVRERQKPGDYPYPLYDYGTSFYNPGTGLAPEISADILRGDLVRHREFVLQFLSANLAGAFLYNFDDLMTEFYAFSPSYAQE